MALTKCSECGREISTLATACPGCGAPSRSATIGASDPRSPQGWRTHLATIFGAWLLAPWVFRTLAFLAGIAMLIAMFALSR